MKLRTACLALLPVCLSPFAAQGQVSVSLSVNIAPPALLVYAQPAVPGDGYIWTPGYWSWSTADRGYYWVPGAWVLAPNDGDLWTPGYWAFERGGYFWHIGYWGAQVGYYGGINYGYGYSGSGYQGGRWNRGAFQYNRAYSNVNTQVVHGSYGSPGNYRPGGNRTSFNGGKSGVRAQPTAGQRLFQAAEHAGPRAEQLEHETAARTMPTQRAIGAHGLPQVAATPQPSEFVGPRVERPAGPPARPQRQPDQQRQPERQRQPQQQREPNARPDPQQQEGPQRKER